MTVARRAGIVLRRAGPIALAAAAALGTTAGKAQDAASAECVGLADPAAEIACLRQALEASRKAQAGAAARPDRATAPAAPAAAPAPVAERPAVLGDEQLPRPASPPRAEQSDPDVVAAAITAWRTDRRGLLVMQLDNGQIWRQDEATDLPVRIDESGQVRVEIARSGFGGYRMSFTDLGRKIAVSRLR